MKKIIYIISLLILLVPLNIEAASVSNARISNPQIAKTGDIISVSFYLNFSGVSAGDLNTFGIGGVVFDLEYDHDVLKYVSANASGFKSNYIMVDDEEGISSVISGEDLLSNSCIDNILFCGEYGITLKFYVRDTDIKETQVKINEVAVLGWNLINGTHPTYDEDDMDGFEKKVNKVHYLTIEKEEIKTEEPPEVKIETSPSKEADISSVVTKKAETKKEEETTSKDKSDNNYLKELDVKGYIFNFYKRDNDYELELPKGVNKLEIVASLEDEKGLLEIVGANDIKGNNNKIEVIVTSESGKKNTYTINIKYVDEKDKKKINKVIILDKVKDIFNDYKLYFYIGGGIILLIIIILIIVNSVNSSKIDKKLNDL